MRKYIKIGIVLCLVFMAGSFLFLKYSSGTVIPIVFSIDDNYAPFVPVTVQSIREHKNDKNIYQIFVLGTGITDKHKKMLEALTSDNIIISVIDINELISKDNRLKELFVNYWFNASIYYRFFIAEILKEYNKAIYIEADSLLLDDIAKIYQIDLNGKMFAAAQQIPYLGNQSEEWHDYCRTRLKMKHPENYFNSGLLVMNLKKMRENNFRENSIATMNTHQFTYMDQDTLNFLYSEDVLLLDPMYDAEVGLIRENDKPILLHFSSLFKPWKQSLPFEMDKSVSSLFWGNSFMPLFWETAKKTPNYAEIVEIAAQNHIREVVNELKKCKSSQNEKVE